MAPWSRCRAAVALVLATAGCSAFRRDPSPAPAAVGPQPTPAALFEQSSEPAFFAPQPPAATLGLPPASSDAAKRGLVTVHYRGASVREVVPELAEKLGRGIAVVNSVRNRLTFDLDGASPRVAIRTFAFHLRADVYALPGGTLVFEGWGRARFPGLLAGVKPVRTVLELLAQRAGATLIVDEAVDGVWTGAIPDDDPARAIGDVCERTQLHAARYGGVIAVSPRPLFGGDTDLDTDKEWRDGLPLLRATIDLRDRTTDEILLAGVRAGHMPWITPPTSLPSQRVTALFVDGAPWTDLVALVARLEHLTVRREGEGITVEPAAMSGSVAATAAPAVPLLWLLAESAGRHVVASPRLRGTLSVPSRNATPEDALQALAALEGLAVLDLGGGLVELLPVGARHLESFGPDPPPLRLPDGRLVPLRLEAVVTSGRGHPSTAALVGGRAVRADDDVALEGTGDVAHVLEIDPTLDRCRLGISSSSGPDEGIWLVLAPLE